MDKEGFAVTVTAQFNATLAGSKPAFLETEPELVRGLSRNLPKGMGYAEAEGIACIYNREAVAQELGLPKGADVDAIVRERLDTGAYGKLLGYGMDTMLERPCTYVSIRDGEKEIFGFMTSPDMQEAIKYAQRRLDDFKREFPEGRWSYALLPIPAP